MVEDRDVDIATGKRIRLFRNMLGLSQTQLAQRIDVTYQQVQKYETGKNRVSASKLVSISKVLGVPVNQIVGESDHQEQIASILEIDADEQNERTKDALELLKAFMLIQDPQVQKSLVKLLNTWIRNLETTA